MTIDLLEYLFCQNTFNIIDYLDPLFPASFSNVIQQLEARGQNNPLLVLGWTVAPNLEARCSLPSVHRGQ